MAVLDLESQAPNSLHDPLLPWLRSVNQALGNLNSGNDSESNLSKLLSDCIKMFKDNAQYRDDPRFLKIWLLHIGLCEDFGSIFNEMLESKICVRHSSLYVWYAAFLESKGKLYEAQMVYQMGILSLVNDTSLQKECQKEHDEMKKTKSNGMLQNDDGETIQSGESQKECQKEHDETKKTKSNGMLQNDDGETIQSGESQKECQKEHDETKKTKSNGMLQNDDGETIQSGESQKECQKEHDETKKTKSNGMLQNDDGETIQSGESQKECQKEHDETKKTKSNGMLQNDDGETIQSGESHINPWSSSTIKDLVMKTNSQIMKYEGCHSSSKAYPRKVALSLQNSSRNKIVEIGGIKYQIKGCAGQGGFAQVHKAYVNSNPDDVVALKIQKPPFPWEFYMYRQLDRRISAEERSSFGFAHGVHLYTNCSILVCDYLANGTLQDAINSYVVIGKSMEEVLCIYYTIEMLYMLEALHVAGIIHGDFKPDNMLIRYARDDLVEDAFPDRSGPWRDQVDTYGLCAIVHLMLHNSYMDIQKKPAPDGGYIYLPMSSFRRYWKVDLWKNLFTKLLNTSASDNDTQLLRDLRESFHDYMCSNPKLIQKLKELLVKQRASLCSA
ncbi:Mitotic checkpoint serine/threonine-protein kinase [Morus notabilis]|uniref:Mitotic checkpoint serine/threonine-protein kinase n=1 Tax=Morus notabilis TaxID=981085 RepID=W9RA72_9ROSA|nr:Mitotic checkpoint serine/threonine-protein kinase [Morus notabilis]